MRRLLIASLFGLFVSACDRTPPAPASPAGPIFPSATAGHPAAPPEPPIVGSVASEPPAATQSDENAEPEPISITQADPAEQEIAESSPQDEPKAVGDFTVEAPVHHKNLSIFPITSKLPLVADRFITLDEGLLAGTVEVLERGASLDAAPEAGDHQRPDGAVGNRPKLARDRNRIGQSANQAAARTRTGDDVNRLTVVNRAEKPLYLMPGEVIVGGSQDRTISEENVIAATGKPVPVSVYCVEHGRWARRTPAQTEMLLAELDDHSSNSKSKATEAARGHFVAKGGYLGKSGRMAAQGGDGQQKVWEQVAEANSKSRVMSSSGAFTANFIDKKVTNQLQPYIEAVTEPLAKQRQIVGVVVAINGKIESADVFESTPLFLKLWPKLVKCYALDALHAVNAESAENSCSAADATTFLDTLVLGQPDETKPAGAGLVVAKRSTRGSVSFLTRDATAAEAPQNEQSGLRGAVHAVGFAKRK